MFYLLYIPTIGVPQPGNEGTYLIVNKTLIEAAAVCVLLVFDTGAIAGLDLLWRKKRNQRSPEVAGESVEPAAPGAKCAQPRNQHFTHARGIGENKP